MKRRQKGIAMNSMTSRRTAAILATAATLLAGCGGGGAGAPSADPVAEGHDVPQSAMTSSAGAFAFVKSVAASSDDTAAPLRVGDAVLATSETDEPDPGV
jgi:hypothetical protein